ncbi:AtpZ/AtpI family protein [Acidomonas methanolica]|uniref:ATP synthase protein I n=1 Tax=Acidomonas methanolica NBRC 104435 TaxID=1231351 RepID=A0A023D6Q8_ACIMT|nr:AtpZ/AtpI family protein [Acidomonas methanolica]TCS23810.1 ATP synthase protein I [Acidomonas methanolica]GAJ29847.1 ATP synthase F0 subunit iota [Acidomonas methanolica NBRC 104435]GBQ53150.1 ATP synthase F0 subunit iota [Acidomonas methanolica]GEL00196.1 hypothetical protein AME01nite_26940 [Acidomonas methanolica NBRC 104435]
MSVRDDHRDTPAPDRDKREFDARLAAAEARLAEEGRYEDGGDVSPTGSAQDYSALGLALRLGTELVSGLAVGVGLGWALDYWLGYRALFLILFSLLGAAAGMLNVWRVVGRTMVDGGASRGKRGKRGS